MGGLQYAVLFACIVTACAFWQTRVNVRNPENNPLLNNPNLGPLQNATECLEKQTNETYLLMFRAKNFEPNITCVSVRANISDASKKIYTFMRQYRNNTQPQSVQYKVRALTSRDYKVENVIRASLDEQDPPETPTPPGSMMYVQYADYDCNSSSSPFMDEVKKQIAVKDEQETTSGDTGDSTTEPKREGIAYLDFYVVYEQSNCSVLRAPMLQGACDFWVAESVAQEAMKDAEKLIAENSDTTENGDTKQVSSRRETDTDSNKFPNALFKSLPDACRYAFLMACRPPYSLMYDNKTCMNEQTTEAAKIEQRRY